MNSAKVLRFGIAGILSIALAGLLLKPAPQTEFYPNREKVIFWHMWSGEWQPIVESACQRFNKSQTKYEIIPLAIPPTGADTKFLLTAAGGKAPDLVSQWMPVKGAWTDKGLLTPIEEVMTPQEKTRFLAEAYPIIKKQSYEDGKIMAAVASIDVYALYVRTDQLKAAGYSLSDIPKTLEKFIVWSRKFDKKNNEGGLSRIGFLPQYGDRYVALFQGNFGTDQNPELDNPINRKAFTFVSEQNKIIGYDKVQRFISSQAADAGINAPLLVGNFTMILDGQWRVKQAKDFAPNLDYAVVPMPNPEGIPGPASMTSANYLMIPKAAQNKKGAWEFIKFWIGFDDPEAGAQNMAEMGWLPYSEKVANSKTYQKYLKDYPEFATFVDLMKSPYLATPPSGPFQAFVSDQLWKVDESVTRGNETATLALEKAQKAIDIEIQRQRKLGNGS